MYINENI